MADLEGVKKTIEEFLQKMGVSFESVEISSSKVTTSPKFIIKSPDSAMLIGIKGANLLAFNHIIKRVVSRGKPAEKADGETQFFIDVNNYHEKLEEELVNKAKIMSERARSFKVDVELEPMSSYERMIIHSFLQNLPDIKTESKGDGMNRRVVIKYTETGR